MVEGGASPHFGQNVAVEVMVVVDKVCVTDVTVPDVIVTGHVVKVVTTISVVTKSEVAGAVVVVTPPVGVFGTHTVPEKVDASPQEVALTLVVNGTHLSPLRVSVIAQTMGLVVTPLVVVVFGTQEPLSSGPWPSAQAEVVVAGVVAGVVLGTHEPLSIVEPSEQVAEVVTGVVVVVMPPVGVFGLHSPLSIVEPSPQEVVVVPGVVATGVVVMGVVTTGVVVMSVVVTGVVVVTDVVVVTPPVGVFGTQEPLSIEEPSEHVAVVVTGVVLGGVGTQEPPVRVSVD